MSGPKRRRLPHDIKIKVWFNYINGMKHEENAKLNKLKRSTVISIIHRFKHGKTSLFNKDYLISYK